MIDKEMPEWLKKCLSCKHCYKVNSDADEIRCRLKECNYKVYQKNKKHLYCKNCDEEIVYCSCCGRELTLTDKRKHQCNACKETFNLCPKCGGEKWKWQ